MPEVEESRPAEPFFLGLVYTLRGLGVPVGTHEVLNLAQALDQGVHGDSSVGYYHLARSILIHHESHLDAFDRAFLAEYGGREDLLDVLRDTVGGWLDRQREGADPVAGPDHAAELGWEQLREMLAERLTEQRERHDGGNYWVGTGGTSPFGQAGQAASGFSTATSGGGRRAVRLADARQFESYRSDVTMDTRHFQLALKQLRTFVRSGAERELDIDQTIRATSANAGELEIVTRPPERPDSHAIVMMDVGGSMYPYSQLMSQLFSALAQSTHFRDLRTYYFHNCVYGVVYESERLRQPVWVSDLIRACGPQYQLIMVGDAYMAPYELQHYVPDRDGTVAITGIEWLERLARHYTSHAWLNPEPRSRWSGSTIDVISDVFQMFPLTLDGLTEAMRHLNRTRQH